MDNERKILEVVLELRDKLSPGLQQTSRKSSASLKEIGLAAKKTGKTLTMSLTAPILAIGVGVVKVAADFESSMNKVSAVSGATGKDLDKLSRQARELGKTTQYSASQSASAMGFLAMAGFEVNEIVGAMPSTLQLAAAAQLDLGTAADITSNILTGFRLEVDELSHANDVLVKTMTSSNVDLLMMGEAMKMVAPIAASAEMQFEEVAAAIGLMGNAGIQGTMAGTSLRMAIASLLTPAGEAEKVIERLGLEVLDTSGDIVPLVDIIEQLELSGAKTADIMTLFGARAGPAMAALLGQGSDALHEFTGELIASGGIAKEIAEKQMEGLKGALKELRSALEEVALAIADAGLLEFLTESTDDLKEFVNGLSETDPELLKFYIHLAAILALAGPILWFLGTAAVAFGTLAGKILLAAGAGYAFGTWLGGKVSQAYPAGESHFGYMDDEELARIGQMRLPDGSIVAHPGSGAAYRKLTGLGVSPVGRSDDPFVNAWRAPGESQSPVKTLIDDLGTPPSETADWLTEIEELLNEFNDTVDTVIPGVDTFIGVLGDDGLKTAVDDIADSFKQANQDAWDFINTLASGKADWKNLIQESPIGMGMQEWIEQRHQQTVDEGWIPVDTGGSGGQTPFAGAAASIQKYRASLRDDDDEIDWESAIGNIIASTISGAASGGGAAAAGGMISAVGAVLPPPYGQIVGALGGIIGMSGSRKRGDTAAQPIHVRVTNPGDIATAVLNIQKSELAYASASGIDDITQQLHQQAGRVGVNP